MFSNAYHFHKILGVDVEASNTDIKKAFRLLALKWHPDREGGCKEKFQEVREAYESLLEEDVRKEDEILDAMRAASLKGNNREVWSLWENEIMKRKISTMGHEAFTYMFEACHNDYSVLSELKRAKELGVLSEPEIEEAVYNNYLHHISINMDNGKFDIHDAMDAINVMDKLRLSVDQKIAQNVFSYMSGVS